MDPDTLRPSEEKEDPETRLEKARKLKEEGASGQMLRYFLHVWLAFEGERW